MKLLRVIPDRGGDGKYIAVFKTNDGEKRVSFGAKGYSDFTKHKNEERKKRYLARHRSNENWSNPLTPGALSRWILWNKTTLEASIRDFKRRFNL